MDADFRQRIELRARSRTAVDRVLAASELEGVDDPWAVPLLDALQRDPDPSVAEAARVTVQGLSPAMRSSVRRAWFGAPVAPAASGDADTGVANRSVADVPLSAADHVAEVTPASPRSQAVSPEISPEQRAIWTVMAPILAEPGDTLGRFLVPRVRGALARTPFDVGVEQVRDAVVAGVARGDVVVAREAEDAPFAAWRIALAPDFHVELGATGDREPRSAPVPRERTVSRQVRGATTAAAASGVKSPDATVLAVVDRAFAAYGRFVVGEARKLGASARTPWSETEIRDAIRRLVGQGRIMLHDGSSGELDGWLLQRATKSDVGPHEPEPRSSPAKRRAARAPDRAIDSPPLATDTFMRDAATRILGIPPRSIALDTLKARMTETARRAGFTTTAATSSRIVDEMIRAGVVEFVGPQTGRAGHQSVRLALQGPELREPTDSIEETRASSQATKPTTFALLVRTVASLIEQEGPIDGVALSELVINRFRDDGLDADPSAVEAAIAALVTEGAITVRGQGSGAIPLGIISAPNESPAEPPVRGTTGENGAVERPKAPTTTNTPEFRLAPKLAPGAAAKASAALASKVIASVRSHGPMLGRHLISDLRAEAGLDARSLPRNEIQCAVESLLQRGSLQVASESRDLDFGQWSLHAPGSPPVRVRQRGLRSLRQIPANEVAQLLEQRGVPRDPDGFRERQAAAAAIVSWYSCRESEDDLLDELLATEWASALH
ncbi:hypothetical protein [Demequina gelatinilytica]|uniref:hypothetical protein n=1 Tax=Demequina gelatinilytica TaxID=1638980 RepID=UPI0012E039F5|nr:hypothetical protein [Demequina gelatinilytica]